MSRGYSRSSRLVTCRASTMREEITSRTNGSLVLRVEMDHAQSGGIDFVQGTKELSFDFLRVPLAWTAWTGNSDLVREHLVIATKRP